MTIEILLEDTKKRLQAPIDRYYDVMEKLDPKSIRGRTASFLAMRQVTSEFKDALQNGMNAAAVLGGGLPSYEAFQEQWTYAEGFLAALPTMSRAQALVRAAMYLPAIVHVYTDTTLQYHADKGELPELPIQPGDGQTECEHWCKCTLRVQHLKGSDFDVYWELHPAEHCNDCFTLNGLWSPLRIRNGVIIDHHDYSFLSNNAQKMITHTLIALLENQGSVYALQD